MHPKPANYPLPAINANSEARIGNASGGKACMRILLIGGYGNFGKRLASSLLAYHNHELVIAGRSREKAKAFAQTCSHQFAKSVETAELDVQASKLAETVASIGADILVNASGPFHLQLGSNRYRVARACIETGTHYIDLADHREFVCQFGPALNHTAVHKGVMLVTGASTVPGLTTAIIDHYLPRFQTLESIDYGISPGNRTERGPGTVGSILSYTGKPFLAWRGGEWHQVFGWQDLRRHRFSGVSGRRWMANCNIPDFELLPARYPDLKSIRFQAGLEVSLLHLGIWFLALLTRARLIDNWARYTVALTLASDWFKAWGSDAGGMFMRLSGTGPNGHRLEIDWELEALRALGPNVPTIAAELVIDRITRGKTKPGAMPCIGLFDLDQFFEVARRWGITRTEQIHD